MYKVWWALWLAPIFSGVTALWHTRDSVRERRVDLLLLSRQYLTTHCMLGMQCLVTAGHSMINLWDSSLLHQSLCYGSFSNNDFTFIIGGKTFHELWFLVDGIYPSLSRFVKPLTVPIDDNEAIFSMWQESKRKDFKPFFGMFKKITFLLSRFYFTLCKR